jgi:hypothetical protein
VKTSPIEINYKNSHLYAIPSVHFHHVFADRVNKLCSHQKKRPDAIAIELGPQAAMAVRNWLKELGVMPGNRKELPVMLGLTQKNRMIRASLKEKALRLQQDTGKDLSELSSDLLYEELGFASNSLICIAPTDSIIEAIRCSLELDVPLYGVDLEETANCDYEKTAIEDPIGASRNLMDFIDRNASYAARRRDTEVDTRREIAMVARLKAILDKHKRVVFACGMAHWPSIRDMFGDLSIRPSSESIEPPEHTNGMFRRVVLHPVKAMQYMDLFPTVVKEYEKHRKPPCHFDNRRINRTHLDPKKIFAGLLKETYADYFANHDSRGSYRQNDLESVGAFEGYLKNLCLMNLREVPDFFTTLSAAQEMMSRDFVKTLTRKCMDFPWTSPDEHPGCPLLAPDPDNDGTAEYAMLEDENMTEDERHFYIRTIPGQDGEKTRAHIPYEWKDEKIKVHKVWKHDFILHTWIPWEYLITSQSLRAIDHVKRKGQVRRVQLFEGSLMDGIDIKATLRSHSRGKETVYVRTTVKEPFEHISETIGCFPVVWLLNVNAREGREWIALYESCDWMKKHVRDRSMLAQVRKSRGGKMIAIIGYGNRNEPTKASGENPSIRSDRYDGIIMYQPICWSRKQFARWAESTGYRRNPFCPHGVLSNREGDLTCLFDKEHGVKIGEYHWTTAMILMALPYAKEIMAVIAPDEYTFDPLIRNRAQRYGVEVCRVSLSSFSQQEIEKLSINHMAPAIFQEPRSFFHESTEAAIGEKQTENEELVQRSCLDFGMM